MHSLHSTTRYIYSLSQSPILDHPSNKFPHYFRQVIFVNLRIFVFRHSSFCVSTPRKTEWILHPRKTSAAFSFLNYFTGKFTNASGDLRPWKSTFQLTVAKVGTLVYLKHHGGAVSVVTGGPRKWWTSSAGSERARSRRHTPSPPAPTQYWSRWSSYNILSIQ